GDRAGRRRQRARRVQARVRHDTRHRLRAHPRPPGRHPREQRGAAERERPQGRPLHRAVRPARHPAGVPAEHLRLHGRVAGGGGRHREGRREDGHRGRDDPGAEADGDHRWLLRRGELRDVRARLRAAVPVDLAGCADLGHGRPAGSLGALDRAARPARGPGRGVVRRRGGGVRGTDPGALRGRGQPVPRDRAAVGRRHHRPRRHPNRARARARRRLPHPAARAPARAVPDVSAMTRTAPFSRVLVANRGEVAVRVTRTLRRLGIASVAVHTPADDGARHVREADLAVAVGSYLDAAAIVAAALRTGAEAVHPGYGFLAESPVLARARLDAGLAGVGPGPAVLELMGDKIAAKAHVAALGVPVVPGVGEDGAAAGERDAVLAARADEVGYPLVVKPSAGGGGKGMQVVREPAALAEAIIAARRVAAAAFGDDTLLLERYVPAPRHVEAQVLGDTDGTVELVGLRECSLQPRHQKVVEEAPAPFPHGRVREMLGVAAVRIARSVDYVGAGTVELLVSGEDPEAWYFLEMNTRLQVEHPVTEEVTGLDLVEAQLRVAAGEPLPGTAVAERGHAVEARVYAERPERGFLPSTGVLLEVVEPTGVRVDSGVATCSRVTTDYDPMLLKVVASAPTREQALDRLDAALAQTVVLGVHTNIDYLRRLLATPAVRQARADTAFLDGFEPPAPTAPDTD